jgi:hypothetical protein
MDAMTPKLMNQALGYIAEKESDVRKGPYFKHVLFHCVSYQLRHDLQRHILMTWAKSRSIQGEYENPFDYLSFIEIKNWENADREKRKKIFRIVDKWEFTMNEKYEFFRQYLEAKRDR